MEQVLKAGENRISKYFNGTSIQGPRFNMQTGLMRNRILNIKEDAEDFLVESTPENAVKILKKHGAKAKIFCIHSLRTRKKTFTIKNNKGEWDTIILTPKSKEEIPFEMLSRVKLLLDRGIKVEKLYIAKAVEHAFWDLAKKEVKNQTKQLSEEISYAAIAVLAGIEEASNALREARKKKKNAMSMIPYYVHLPDPVLLARVKGYNELIEIGRWE